MDRDAASTESYVRAERRRKEIVCLSCPCCAGAVPVLARCVDGDVEPILECRTCGWVRRARRGDPA